MKVSSASTTLLGRDFNGHLFECYVDAEYSLWVAAIRLLDRRGLAGAAAAVARFVGSGDRHRAFAAQLAPSMPLYSEDKEETSDVLRQE